MDDGIIKRLNPEWVTPDMPQCFQIWVRTDSEFYADRMQEAGWKPIPGVAWGIGGANTWCAWDNDGIVAWNQNDNGPHWVRHPNTKFQYAFEITPLF